MNDLYILQISIKFRDKSKTLPKKYQEAIRSALYELKENPQSGKLLRRSLKNKYSYRIGAYRIIYKINKRDRFVQIISLGHRSIIYK